MCTSRVRSYVWFKLCCNNLYQLGSTEMPVFLVTTCIRYDSKIGPNSFIVSKKVRARSLFWWHTFVGARENCCHLFSFSEGLACRRLQFPNTESLATLGVGLYQMVGDHTSRKKNANRIQTTPTTRPSQWGCGGRLYYSRGAQSHVSFHFMAESSSTNFWSYKDRGLDSVLPLILGAYVKLEEIWQARVFFNWWRRNKPHHARMGTPPSHVNDPSSRLFRLFKVFISMLFLFHYLKSWG
jgi:hypothetical protein